MPFSAEEAAHLLRRAAWGGSADEAEALARQGLDAAVSSLLENLVDDLDLPRPGPDGQLSLHAAQAWWLRWMVLTDHPLEERMTLFWHNHFATANGKVGHPELMLRQNQLFRRHALGNFRQLLREVTRDAAMLIWLDGNASHRRAPNENYAREMMELFALGPGNYSEADVHALARALTGFHLRRISRAGSDDIQIVWDPRDHDGGLKTLLGRTGPWGPDEAIDIVLDQPAHGPFLMRKLWSFFVGPEPSDADIEPLVRLYRESGFELRPAIRSLLQSTAFYEPRHRLNLVRNPAELVVAALRALGLPSNPTSSDDAFWSAVLHAMAQMGMELFNPPSVAGWPGGLSSPLWLNAGTLAARFRFAAWVSDRFDLNELTRDGGEAKGLVESIARRLGLTLSATTRGAASEYASQAASRPSAVRGVVELLLSSPEFQLK